MLFLRHHRSFVLFSVLLAVSSVMVVRQALLNQTRHVDLREAFILLDAKGHKPEAQRIYQQLILDLEHAPDRALLDDFQRTSALVNPAVQQPENLVWKYHWTVNQELEKRSESAIARALKQAEAP